MREIERKLLSELMKNSRRSDSELAKVIGASQPTVTRARNKLEKEGYIREYTMIPDFHKLGYQIMALTFVKLRKKLGFDEVEKARRIAKADVAMKKLPCFSSVIMLESGIGLGSDGVFVSLHED